MGSFVQEASVCIFVTRTVSYMHAHSIYNEMLRKTSI